MSLLLIFGFGVFVGVLFFIGIFYSNEEKNDDKLELLEDEYGISPGQACVFYSKNELGYKVLGGGWISKN